MATPKTTSAITFGTWTTIQMALSGANNFSDTAPSDDVAGVTLVHERGIWKYPLQTSGGRIEIPENLGKPLRLANVMADFGASTAWEIFVAGFDGTGGRPDNASGEPYDAGDAANYREGAIRVDSGTDRYLAKNMDPADAGIAALIHPGQHVYVTTAAASSPIIRLSFSLASQHL